MHLRPFLAYLPSPAPVRLSLPVPAMHLYATPSLRVPQCYPGAHAPASIFRVALTSMTQILGFGADLAEDHPGFHDPAYKQRRAWLAEMAKTHRMCVWVNGSYGGYGTAAWAEAHSSADWVIAGMLLKQRVRPVFLLWCCGSSFLSVIPSARMPRAWLATPKPWATPPTPRRRGPHAHANTWGPTPRHRSIATDERAAHPMPVSQRDAHT